MIRKVALLTLGAFVTGLTIAILHNYAAVSEPFRASDVTEVRFRHSIQDSVQICVREAAAIERIVGTVRLREKPGCLCVHPSEVVFVVNGRECVASIGSQCFEFYGSLRGDYHMPARFYAVFQAYRDSVRYREHWDNPNIMWRSGGREHADGRP
jgi:hypothetical protein